MSLTPVERDLLPVWWHRVLISLCASLLIAISLVLLPETSFGGIGATATELGLTALGLMMYSGLLLVLERVRGSTETSGLGWHTNTPRLLAFGACLAALIIGVYAGIVVLVAGYFQASSPGLAFIPTTIALIVMHSCIEEIVFRGTVFEALHEHFGAATAILTTSLLFGVAHASNPSASLFSVANTVLAGILLGVLVTKTHSLYAAMSFHALWNVLVALFVGNVSGRDMNIGVTHLHPPVEMPQWVFGGTYGIEEGALTTALFVAGIVIVLRFAPLDAETRAARFRRSFKTSPHPVK